MKIREYAKYISIVIMVGFMSFFLACSDDGSTTADDEMEEEEMEEETTADNDMSVLVDYFDTESGNVSVVVDDQTITITTKDLPDHVSVYYATDNPLYENYTRSQDSEFTKNPGTIEEQNIVMEIPRFPEVDSNHESPGLGPMGVAVNSVVYFNQQAAPDDDILEELKTFDQYEGHPAGDTYHYHIEPIWLTETKGSDAFLGFLLDGFPVYGPMENGKEVTNDDLDDYHGHTSVTADFPNGVYHYHVTTEFPWINGDGFYGTPGTKTQ
ncbi:MAG: YHYH protein [Cyclobacteriaceae bacterium]